MRDPFSARVRALFTFRRDQFWWNYYNDYEQSLSRMRLAELAEELQRTKVRREDANTVIVEHLLAARLGRLQSNATLWAAVLGACVTLAAVGLTFALGVYATNSPPAAKCLLSVQGTKGK